MSQQIPTKPVKSLEEQERTWALVLHLSQFAYYVVPVAGIIAPIVIWQLKKDEFPSLDAHGKVVANWLITAFIAFCICIPLMFIVIGIPLFILLMIAHVTFACIGGIKAYSGEVWQYPGTMLKIF